MSSDDLKKIFDESIGSTKAYFISKVQQKFPRLDKKDIETWFKSQEVVQINTTLKGVNLKITAKPRTFQIDIMFYRIGQSLKPFLLLVDIMSRKAFCYSIPGEKNMTKIITAYNKFLQEVDYVNGVEGDGEFDNTAFKKLNEEKVGHPIDSGMGLSITIDKLRVFINKTLSTQSLINQLLIKRVGLSISIDSR